MSDNGISETPVDKAEVVQPAPTNPPGESEKSLSIREAIEAQVIAKNEEVPAVILDTPEEAPKSETPVVSEAPKELSTDAKDAPVESLEGRIKAKVQKRIDKEVAKRKTLEEQLDETRAELALARQGKLPVESNKSDKTDVNREPTDSEISAALRKAREEGDVDFEVQIMNFVADRKAKAQRMEAEAQIRKSEQEAQNAQVRQQRDWETLVRDYLVYDDAGNIDNSSDMNLNNTNGKLYKTALALFQDKDLAGNYADENKILGFRRAVHDAYRGLIETQSMKKEPTIAETVNSGDFKSKAGVRKVTQLAEPGSAGGEDVPSNAPRTLSDAEKVTEEIKHRLNFRKKVAGSYI
jgi:hypothetical protein